MVSIVVPIYNAEKFLPECIDSILTQSYKDFELLLINNGSTDKSLEICKKYEKDNDFIKVYDIEEKGVCFARNTGMRQAIGDYICFVDADDILAQDFLEIFIHAIEKEKVDVVFGNMTYLYPNNKYLNKKPRIAQGKYFSEELRDKAIDDGTITGILFGSVCAAMYDLKFLRENSIYFDTKVKRNEDGLFNLTLLKKNTHLFVLDYAGYYYRQWKSNVRHLFQWDSALEHCSQAISNICSDFQKIELQLKRRRISILFWNMIKLENSSDSFSEAIKIIKKTTKNYNKADYTCLSYSETNIYKKVLIFLLKNRLAFAFLFIIRYIVPIMKKKIKR